MAQPPAYVPAYDFTNWQSSNPADPLPANSIDAEFNAIQTTTDGIRTNLALIQRDDGLLVNGSVHKDAFSTASLALMGGTWTPQGNWATATAYAASDMVEQSNATYVCVTAHTSGTFSADLAAGKWMLFATGGSAANITYDPSTSGLTATNVSAALDELASEINGYLAKSVAGADDVTLSATEIRNGFLKLTGALTGNIDVIVPDDEDGYAIWNATSGAYSLTVKTLAGSGVVVTQGAKADLWCDGTDVIGISATDDYVAAASLGLVVVSGNDTTPADLETKILVAGPLSLSTQNDGANETRTITADVASQGEAETGTASDVLMTPQRTAQAIAALADVAAVETDVRLAFLLIAENSGDRLNMVDGISDPFADESDIDTATSANETYDATGDYYHNPGPASVDTGGTPTSAYGGTAANANDNSDGTSWTSGSLTNFTSATAAQRRVLIVDLGSVKTVNQVVVDNASFGSGSVNTVEVQYSTDGTSYSTLGATFTVNTSPSSTTRTGPVSARYLALYIGSGDFSGVAITVRDFEITTVGDPPNMTVVSDPFTADSSPDIGRVHVQADPQDAITINTDLTAEISRDGGSTWTAATLVAAVETLADGTIAYEDSSVDISGQPSGTSMKYRLKTFNNKNVRLHGVVFQWA